jgi:ABC-type amino acid transport system permease subunit
MNWFDKLSETFLTDNRYMWLVDGLGVTMIITLGALAIGVLIGLLAIFMHRANIGRLLAGTEKKATFSKFKKQK